MDSRSEILKDFVRIAAMTAILEAAKFLLNALPNVELVTLLLIVFTLHFKRRMVLCAALLFALIETLWWGISIWTVTYFYVWPLLVLIVSLFSESDSVITFTVISTLFGMFFGMLCALTTLAVSGWNAAVAWWIAGIPYDLVHGFFNGILCLLLFKPLQRALNSIRT